MTTSTRLMTADELLMLPRGQFRYELVEGELMTMPPSGIEHGMLAVNVAALLVTHARAKKLGVVLGAETGFKLRENPDTVLAPDASFITRERILETGIPGKYWPGAPDLAVEIISPGDRAREVETKVGRWLEAGSRLVWVVNPKRKIVTVHRAGREVLTLSEKDELAGEDVLPGFSCRVSDVFTIF